MNKYEEYLKTKNWDIKFRYMLLDRMRSNCDYFLGYYDATAWNFIRFRCGPSSWLMKDGDLYQIYE